MTVITSLKPLDCIRLQTMRNQNKEAERQKLVEPVANNDIENFTANLKVLRDIERVIGPVDTVAEAAELDRQDLNHSIRP
ncbi:hypothetical protein Lste_1758 [Legionella steelei]|uniref:Uncharacterized protein n=1 Tax=Legionella steelei TaxID=947033 RepID=A0A0W0ZHY6_9GAMM|nr:hypothetical protein [Legionella steelei]KTD68600.1 hypothetical protein Lste_1758 [Legionella steelei]